MIQPISQKDQQYKPEQDPVHPRTWCIDEVIGENEGDGDGGHVEDAGIESREEGKDDIVLAKEKGYNTYVKVDDSRCAGASKWWKENQEKWALVRAKWDEVYGRNTTLELETKVDNKVLYKYLFDEGYEEKAKIDGVIESFVKK